MSLLPMGDLLRHHAERKPARTKALIHPEGALTWRGLEDAANRRARLYQSKGVRPGDFVALALGNGNAFVEAVFAIWKLGAIPAPISASMPSSEAGAILELVRPTLLIAGEGDWPALAPRLPADADLAGLSGEAFETAPPAAYWKALASGGSTGRPKVIVSHRPAAWDPDSPFMDQTPGGAVLNPCPLYHNAGFLVVATGLFCGATVVGMRRFDAEEALALIDRHRVDWVTFVPTMMHRIHALREEVRARYDLSSLRRVWHGTSAMPPWLKRAWIEWLGPERIWEVYGGTEGQGSTMIGGEAWLERPGSVGRLNTPGQMKVFAEDGREAAPGEIGEIAFLPAAGAGSTYHYLGAEARRRDGGWESLGDDGWMDADGYLYLADRRTDLIVRGGANIYPAEVEAALDAHPAVASSLVIGLAHGDLGRVPHALVEPRAGATIDPAELRAFLLERLVKYKVPESFELSATPLRDDAGKARRTALRDERDRWQLEGRAFRLALATA